MLEWEALSRWPPGDERELLRSFETMSACTTRLISSRDRPRILEDILTSALELCRAEAGNVQLVRPETGTMQIAASSGLSETFLAAFAAVSTDDPSACGRALRTGRTVVVEDTERDAEFAPYRAVARAAGIRAVQSTPMIGSDGTAVGMISTHFREPWPAVPATLQMMSVFARQAADILIRLGAEEAYRARSVEGDRLAAELDHRLKNIITMVQSISRLTRKGSSGLTDYADAFERRLQLLARAQSRLSRSRRLAVTVEDVVRDELAPYDDARTVCRGPAVRLSGNSAFVLSLVVHELAVNALKYGALSLESGTVSTEWEVEEERRVVVLRWTERGGPPVTPPVSRGFGTTLFHDLNRGGMTRVDVSYAREGVICDIEMPFSADTDG